MFSRLLANRQTQLLAKMQSMRHFGAKKKTAEVAAAKKKTHGVYMWSKMPRLGAKSGSVSTNL